MKNISCLVISKSYKLLNKLLKSLEQAKQEWLEVDEVLCSWNGSIEESTLISRDTIPHFRIEQRSPYHFATNVNSLARKAEGKYILIVNDDVILDPGCIDKAIEILEGQDNIGIVGGLLRNNDETLSHAGVLFNYQLTPYNRCRPEYGNHISIDSDEVRRSGPITAVTGALMLISKDDLLKVPMREDFTHCCEDIALCIDLLANTKKTTYYSSSVTAIHNEKSTRGETDDKQDFKALAGIVESLQNDIPELWATNIIWQRLEIEWLSQLCYQKIMSIEDSEAIIQKQAMQLQIKDTDIKRLEEELDSTLQATIEAWNKDRSLLLGGQEMLGKRINELEASTSWKITKPIRAFMSQMHRLTKK